ncbi:hypothetical protein AMTRI_Chr03g138230 [Amborella trichopoda]
MAQSPAPCADHATLDVVQDEGPDMGQRSQWLRAMILGASDGLVSTASLMIGIGAAVEEHRAMLLSGLAGAVAGACSMAVGEFVSVSTQRDIEMVASTSKLKVVKLQTVHNLLQVLKSIPEDQEKHTIDLESPKTSVLGCSTDSLKGTAKLGPLADKSPIREVPKGKIRVSGMSPMRSPMMRAIAESSIKRIVTRDSPEREDRVRALPNPFQAASASALAFLCGSIAPLVSSVFVVGYEARIMVLAVVSSMALVVLGGVGARLGGSNVRVSAFRALLGGWLAMLVTFGILKPFERKDRE